MGKVSASCLVMHRNIADFTTYFEVLVQECGVVNGTRKRSRELVGLRAS
jgi:hypothetical protein